MVNDKTIKTIVVDDEPPARRNLRALLKRDPDIELVKECGNGREAVSSIRALQPDLVLMDINLPGMSGEDALRDLRRHPATAAVPVIAVSADAMSEDVARYKAAGFQAYVTKPFNIAELIGLIRRCIAGQA